MQLPYLNQKNRSVDMIQIFRGLNENPRPGDGEWAEMSGLWSGDYPCAASRPRRGIIRSVVNPQGMAWKHGLVLIEDGKVLYREQGAGRQEQDTGLRVTEDGEKQIVSMGAYIVIFPDRVYFNTADLSDQGSIDNAYSRNLTANLTLCDIDGKPLETVTASADEPENPTEGMIWYNTETKAYSRWSITIRTWVSIPSTYIKVEAAGIHEGFSRFDGIRILFGWKSLTDTVVGCTAEENQVIEAIGTGYIVITGIMDQNTASYQGWVTATREAPQMDYVCSGANRIWGCRYGEDENGKIINEIYCCVLGDFKNWSVYRGISTDSYRASRGSDGEWTGAAYYNGCPMFFKEDCIETVYVSSSGAHQIVEKPAKGVAKGSHKSLAVVDDILWYHATDAIMAYDGNTPVTMSEALGREFFEDVAAGGFGKRYFFSGTEMSREGFHYIYAYDASNGTWWRDSGTEAKYITIGGDNMYIIEQIPGGFRLLMQDGKYQAPDPREPEISWSAETGPIGLNVRGVKWITRISLRMWAAEGTTVKIYSVYDEKRLGLSDLFAWQEQHSLTGEGTMVTVTIPIFPHRADTMRLMIAGTGDWRLYSMSKIMEEGSDVR